MRGQRWVELRTALAGTDPGLERLTLASVALGSMALAVAVMAWVRALTGQPVTLLVLAAVLAMVSNIAVNEPGLARRRVTTALMALPAAAAVAVGALLAPYHLVADVVFVAVTVAAVYVRRFGPRGFALGMAAFMPYFITQFLQARVEQLPWLLVAVGAGVGSTLLLRGFVLPEREDRTLARMLRAFTAHVHGYVVAVEELLATAAGPDDVEAAVRDARRRRARLNDTALRVVDRLDRPAPGDAGTPGPADLGLRMLDTELAAERLGISTRRLLDAGGGDGADRDRLRAGMRALAAASATGTPAAMVPALLEEARHSVAALAAGTGERDERSRRVAFAVARLADALDRAEAPVTGPAPDRAPEAESPEAESPEAESPEAESPEAEAPDPAGTPEPQAARAGAPETETETETETARAGVPEPAGATEPQVARAGPPEPPGPPEPLAEPAPERPDPAPGLRLTTRQALQAGVAVGLAIVAGELVSPSRWYWAAVAAFVVFAGTNSRGDILSRGWTRVLGTAGGVAAGMALAFVVGDHAVPALAALAVCVFLALYLVRISQALMAFWITAVLALMYGLTGQFSVATLVLRIEETAVGALMGVLAASIVLPRRTRDAHAEALDALVDAVDAVVGAAADRIAGRVPATPPVELARHMGDALGTLRQRTAPLVGPLPWRRARTGYRDLLHVLTGVDHYARALARASDTARDPGWAPTLLPAADRVRANLGALRGGAAGERDVRPAEELVNAAEAWAARCARADDRRALLEAVRLLRRIDQSVVGLLTAGRAAEGAAPEPAGRR